MKRSILYALLVSMGISACDTTQQKSQEKGIRPIDDCRNVPAYFSQTKFDHRKPFGFSVGEATIPGLTLVQFATQGQQAKRFSFPSWTMAGHLGAVVTDQQGNNYVIPRPFINTLLNNPKNQNTIYKVDTQSGQMASYITLPVHENTSENKNPFGLLGIVYDCETKVLYGASVAGSDQDHVAGTIYGIQTQSPEVGIQTKLEKVDAMGLGLVYLNGTKNLFFGNARGSDIYRVELAQDGRLKGDPIFVTSIGAYGERGNDKPRKIRFTKEGNMLVSGVTFNFTLANQPEQLENIYTFQYDSITDKWEYKGIRQGIQ